MQVKNFALEWLRTFPSLPRDASSLERMCSSFLDEMKALKISHVFLHCAATNENSAGWAKHLEAPSIGAAEAMRQELIAITQQHLLALRFEGSF